MAEPFRIEDYKKILDDAKRNINIVLDEYNEELNKLDNIQKNYLQLYFLFNKRDTVLSMNPKGKYSDKDRERNLKDIDTRILNCFKEIDESISIDEIKDKVNSYMNNSGLLTIINSFSNSIKEEYKKAFGDRSPVVFTASSFDLSELKGSHNRENQYWNKLYDSGVFAAGEMGLIEMYVARASSGGGMIVKNNRIDYPENPFDYFDDNGAHLKNDVFIYTSNVDDYIPQFDYVLDKNGARFIFGDEWVAPKESVDCEKMKIDYLPNDFLISNKVYADKKRILPDKYAYSLTDTLNSHVCSDNYVEKDNHKSW